MLDVQNFIQKLKAEQEEEPEEVIDYGERIKMLEYALEQLVDFKNCDDIPESVVDAFVDRIIVSEDSYDWYLRLNPELAYQCKVEGKRAVMQRLPLPLPYLTTRRSMFNWGTVSSHM